MSFSKLPTKVLAGVTVVDSPLIDGALQYARAHSDDMTYNHVIRSWLFGVIIYTRLHAVGAMPELDLEAHAISAIFHDLGWDNTYELVSKDKTFEVDGAIAARSWLEKQGQNDVHRNQLIWDAIALHATPKFSAYKEPVVQLCGLGIVCDFHGPDSDQSGVLTWDDYNTVKEAYPRHNLAGGLREKIVHFCREKPETTYDSWQQEYGRKYIKGYEEEQQKKSAFGMLESSLGD